MSSIKADEQLACHELCAAVSDPERVLLPCDVLMTCIRRNPFKVVFLQNDSTVAPLIKTDVIYESPRLAGCSEEHVSSSVVISGDSKVMAASQCLPPCVLACPGLLVPVLGLHELACACMCCDISVCVSTDTVTL